MPQVRHQLRGRFRRGLPAANTAAASLTSGSRGKATAQLEEETTPSPTAKKMVEESWKKVEQRDGENNRGGTKFQRRKGWALVGAYLDSLTQREAKASVNVFARGPRGRVRSGKFRVTLNGARRGTKIASGR